MYVQTFGNDDIVADNDGRIERSSEALTGTLVLGVNRIDGADADDGASRNSDGDGLRRRWRRRRSRHFRLGLNRWRTDIGGSDGWSGCGRVLSGSSLLRSVGYDHFLGWLGF